MQSTISCICNQAYRMLMNENISKYEEIYCLKFPFRNSSLVIFTFFFERCLFLSLFLNNNNNYHDKRWVFSPIFFILFCNMRLKTQQHCRFHVPWSTEVRDFIMKERSPKTIQIMVTRDVIFPKGVKLKSKLGCITAAWYLFQCPEVR